MLRIKWCPFFFSLGTYCDLVSSSGGTYGLGPTLLPSGLELLPIGLTPGDRVGIVTGEDIGFVVCGIGATGTGATVTAGAC